MNKEQYVKNEIEKIKSFYNKDYRYSIPYIYDVYSSDDVSDIRPSSIEELHNLLDKAVDVGYFSDEDCLDGGIIERVAYQFDKRLPADWDFDCREYDSFFFRDEETKYYVFFLDSWPKNNEE